MPKNLDTIAAFSMVRVLFIVLWLSLGIGCSKRAASAKKPTEAPTQVADKVASAQAPTSPAAATSSPAVDLGMPVDRFVEARLWQRCARKYGETSTDAFTVAIDWLSKRAHQPIPLEVVASIAEVTEEAPGLPAAVTSERPPAVVDFEAAAVKMPKDKRSVELRGDGLVETKQTPAGRWAVGRSDAATVSQYKQATKRAESSHPAILERIDNAVKGCLYAPELGLLNEKFVARYIDTFVAITCLAKSLRDEKGKVNAVAHGHAAAKVFAKHNVSAREFSETGLLLARFPSVERRSYAKRAATCPEPGQAERKQAGSGRFEGTLVGQRKATLALTATEGALEGTVTFAVVAGGDNQQSAWKLRGALNENRIHLFGAEKQDWIRLEAKRAGSGYAGHWTGEMAFKKVTGTWTMARVKAAGDSASKAADKAP